MKSPPPPASLPLYQVDAFSSRLFGGNPAAVCPLEYWLPDTLLQAIATENNLAETAFFVARPEHFELRWFTPTHEVKLCGHATLASAFVLWNCLGESAATMVFDTRHSGRLTVSRDAGLYWLDLPRHPVDAVAAPESLLQALNVEPTDCRQGPNWLLRLDSQAQLLALRPDMRLLAALPERGVIVTAPADDTDIDFVSRFFAPNFGVDEDPVTGSAHCMLTPYWVGQLGRDRLSARQLSARGGALECELSGERVRVGGQARLYLKGSIYLPED